MKQFLLSVIIISSFISSCKKSNSTPPEPEVLPLVTKPDTLTSGWRKINVSNNFINEIFFQNNTLGYLAGKNGIFKSIDGGVTWSFLNDRFVLNIAVTNNGNAFFVKDSIYKTVNAGLSFTNLYSPNASDIYFVNNNEGFFINSNQLFKTIDAGSTWQNVAATNFPNSGGGYSSICFNSNNNGVLVNALGIYRTNGGITNWIPVNFSNGINYTNFQAAFFTPNNNIYAITRDGKLFKSIDTGINFSLIKDFNNGNNYGDVHFIDNNTGYASNGNRIYKTTDAGLNWLVEVALGDSSIIEIHFTDANHGWACTEKGSVLIYN